MADLDAFVKLLDATVRAPRLSGTKTKQLAQDSLAIPSANDTKVVSAFLKLHNSLAPACQQRISSLYVFDAIARENKKASGKEGFMSKMEGVVESWVGGMVDNGKGGVWTEGRDKMRKILDIWTKTATFPRSCLDRLEQRMNAGTPVVDSTTPPYSPGLPPLSEEDRKPKASSNTGQGTPISPPAAPGTLPPEIQKLLGIQHAQAQAASAGGGVDIASILAGITKPMGQASPLNATASTPAPGFNFDPTQLAALASLAKPVSTPPIAAGVPPRNFGLPPAPQAGGYVPPPNMPPFAPAPSLGGPSQFPNGFPGLAPNIQNAGFAGPGAYGSRSPQRDDARGHGRRPSADRGGYHNVAARPRSRSPRRRDDWGGDVRGGGGGGHGAGGWGGSDMRDSRDSREVRDTRDLRGGGGGGDWERNDWGDRADRGGDRGGGGRGRGRGGGFNDRPSRDFDGPRDSDRGYATDRRPPPPERPNFPPAPPNNGRAAIAPQQGKDEFGRDLPTGHGGSIGDASQDRRVPPRQGMSPLNRITPQSPAQSAPVAHGMPQRSMGNTGNMGKFGGGGKSFSKPSLETFDHNTFNPNEPAAWAGLAEAWEASKGRPPNQIELMEFLMTAQMGAASGGGGGMGMGGGANMGGMGGQGGFGGAF